MLNQTRPKANDNVCAPNDKRTVPVHAVFPKLAEAGEPPRYVFIRPFSRLRQMNI